MNYGNLIYNKIMFGNCSIDFRISLDFSNAFCYFCWPSGAKPIIVHTARRLLLDYTPSQRASIITIGFSKSAVFVIAWGLSKSFATGQVEGHPTRGEHPQPIQRDSSPRSVGHEDAQPKNGGYPHPLHNRTPSPLHATLSSTTSLSSNPPSKAQYSREKAVSSFPSPSWTNQHDAPRQQPG